MNKLRERRRVGGGLGLLISLFTFVVPGRSFAQTLTTPSWIESRVNDSKIVRLLASVSGTDSDQTKRPIRWCLSMDGAPITNNYAIDFNGSGDTKSGTFDSSTGCWSSSSGMLVAAAEIPAAKLPPGERTFSYQAIFGDGRSEQISTKLVVPRVVPVIYWRNAAPTGVIKGRLPFSVGADNATSKWCLSIDGQPVNYNAAVRSNADSNLQLFGATFSFSDGCWSSKDSLLIGDFEIATQLLKNGRHVARLTVFNVNGESSTLEQLFTTRNRTTAEFLGLSTAAVKRSAKTTSITLNAQFTNAATYVVKIGTSKSKLSARKSGKIKSFGRISSTVKGLRPSTTYFIQITATGINGVARSKIVRFRTESPPPPTPRTPVSTTPVSTTPSTGGGGQPPINTPVTPYQTCSVKRSSFYSDVKGPGYDWVIFVVDSSGARELRRGTGYPGGTWQDQLPAICGIP